MSTHAKLSPSGYARWMNCPGSVALIDHLLTEGLIVEGSTSFAAEEGSAAHALAEWGLIKDPLITDYIGVKIYGDIKVTEEMCEAVQVYLDFIYGCINAADEDFIDTKLEVEVKCSLKSYRVPGMDGGTSDTVLTYENHCIHVIDYKHGKGVAVDVGEVLTISDRADLQDGDFILKNGHITATTFTVLRHANGQLMQYGLGALLKQPKREEVNIVLTIVQPRAFHPDGPIRSIEISGKDLIRWGKEVLVPAGKATLKKNAPLIAGEDQCRWCPVARCSARDDLTNQIAILDFETETFQDPRLMTEEQMIFTMNHADMIRKFLTEVECEARNLMDKGNKEFDGCYKLVTSRTNRKLTNEAVEDLTFYIDEDKLYNKNVKGLGDIEKALKPDYTKKEIDLIMEEVTTKEPGKTVIAPISDKRKSIESSVVSDFDGLDDDDFDEFDDL